MNGGRVSAAERNLQLDVLRGLAICLILIMNIPFMAGYVMPETIDPRWFGWSPADQAATAITWWLDGTMRGLLTLLFGAGMMIMTRATLRPDGPVGVADIFFRRNLWLIAFGVFNGLVLMWSGDILLPYGIAALLVFAFRLLKPTTKLAIGATILMVLSGQNIGNYFERQELLASVATAEAKQEAKQPLSADEKKALEDWREKLDRYEKPDREAMTKERAERLDTGIGGYWMFSWDQWTTVLFEFGGLWWGPIEAFAGMLIGAALWQWRVLGGGRSPAFYVAMLAIGYGVFGGLRALAVNEYFAFAPGRGFIGMVMGGEFTRMPIVLGHVALVSLLLRAAVGRALLRPFAANGKLPLTTYFSASAFGTLFFAGFAGGQWGAYSAAGQLGLVAAVVAAQVVVANLWLTRFETGPAEWAWKSLAYGKRQPFARATAAPVGAVGAAAE